jgi:formylmethanofuran dehydrogenase subunit E
MKRTFQEDLAAAVAFHGHLCAGQYLGTRIARIALEHFGIEEPERYRDLICFVECDRCLADAVASVCHCSLGRRRLKFHDQGKMAAVFYDLSRDEAIRIYVKGTEKSGPDDDIVTFYDRFSDEEFFEVQPVKVHLDECDLPGRPRRHAICAQCGEQVKDGREIVCDGVTLCKTCAGEDVYYQPIG